MIIATISPGGEIKFLRSGRMFSCISWAKRMKKAKSLQGDISLCSCILRRFRRKRCASSSFSETSYTEYFMNKYRPVFASLIALLFYTVVDILIWQRVFEANNMVEYAHTYHAGWFVSLAD